MARREGGREGGRGEHLILPGLTRGALTLTSEDPDLSTSWKSERFSDSFMEPKKSPTPLTDPIIREAARLYLKLFLLRLRLRRSRPENKSVKKRKGEKKEERTVREEEGELRINCVPQMSLHSQSAPKTVKGWEGGGGGVAPKLPTDGGERECDPASRFSTLISSVCA